MPKDIYRLTDAEHQIFERAASNPNLFTNWYLRSDRSGTYADVNNTDPRYILLHKALMQRWFKLDRPRKFDFTYSLDEVPLAPLKAVTGQVFMRGLVMPTVSCPVYVQFSQDEKRPSFFVNHGFWSQDWQVEMMQLPQDAVVLIGGYGSSKTSLASIDMLIKAATLPGFAGFVIAPGSIASTAVYEDKWIGRMSGTLYEKRFLVRNLRKQPQEIGIGNDHVGYSSIKFYSVHDNQDKIKNIEGDMAHIDQAEQLQDISTMNGNVGSRLRGNFQGRNRVGKIYWIANPNDTPDLWNMADDSIEHPQFTYYKQISTYENWALSEDDIRRFERKVGKTENERNSNLFGFRPVGDGKQFSGESIKNCLSTDLDDKMNAGIAAGKPGFVKEDAPRIGIWKWELPYEEGHTYVVIADPGQDSPPNRNAAAIGVWDITGFPDNPAQMTAFHWVFGNNSPIPWMTSFFDYVERYKAVGRCGYDSTGWQSGYLQWVETFAKIQSTGMNMNQSNKYTHLNSAKQLMNRALIKYPTIQMMTSQLAKYDMPEPSNLIQDIVVMIMLTCTWLQQYFYLNTREDDHQISAPVERHVWRPTSRASASRR